MKILMYTDVHWSKTSSLVTQRSTKYTKRLELLIDSVNWAERLSEEKSCDAVVMLGDFFDKYIVNDEESTALKELKWSNMPHYNIVGNHESYQQNLEYSSTSLLETKTNIIVNEKKIIDTDPSVQLCFLPYITERDREDLVNYFPKTDKKRIIFSHNDISGIKYGAFESKIGFNQKEIEENCDLFLNGHLHNGCWISKKILNLGSLSAHNFTNDSFNYKYGAWILDTDTLQLDFYENPYSLNFYAYEISSIGGVNFDSCKANSVVKVACKANLEKEVREIIEKNKNIINSKITKVYDLSTASEEVENAAIDIKVNYLDKLVECCKQNIDNNDILEAELAEICK